MRSELDIINKELKLRYEIEMLQKTIKASNNFLYKIAANVRLNKLKHYKEALLYVLELREEL